MELTLKQKTAFGIGAVGKDMVYACRLLMSCIIIRMCWDFRQALWDWCLWQPGSSMPSTTLYGGSGGKDPHSMGTFPSVDLFRYAAQCAGALRPVCRPCAGRSSADGLFQRDVHPMGRYLYHDGYSLLVHDSRRDPHAQRPGESFHGGAYLCRRWLCLIAMFTMLLVGILGAHERAGFRWVAFDS